MNLSSMQGAIERFDKNNNEKLDPEEAYEAGASLARDVFGANGRQELLKFGNDNYALLAELIRLGSQGDLLADAVVKHLTDRALLPSGERDASGQLEPLDRQAVYARLQRGDPIANEEIVDAPGGSPDDQPTSNRQRGAVR